ncbi:helix-turn-helix domain-containing protein [Fenollaria timonensis]|uniref:AlbA family DNA-binding domain-containing protein n=1 Tax=Fenollaria timonensis TaxID=1723384 RepID=UPI0026EA7BBB|nr:RNA-binding domain-containing protein [Fenollaria timonensis]
MTIEEIKKLIATGEKIDVELKESRNALNKDIYDTVASFNNRTGGHIILGVNDKREIVGVNPAKVDKMIKDFTTAINNPKKIYPPLYLTPEHIVIDGKDIIHIQVPEGYQVCRHGSKIFDRSYEGDVNITDSSELVYKMYARKQGSYFVNKVFPNLTLDCLDSSIIARVRKRASIRNQNHSWKDMTDEELLRSANLILIDPQTGREGLTLAAILLFGKDNAIMSVLPQHKTDAIFRVVNKDRYDDRDVITTNLIDSYDRLIAFGQKHLNDLFVLDGIVNVSARDRILREIVSNTLAHRDYSSGFPAKMIIDDEKIVVENSNLAHGIGALDIKKFEPFPKNPPISKVFREIGLADELGSGMRNTYKYTRLYSATDPIFEEGDVFRTIVPLKRIATEKVGSEEEDNGNGPLQNEHITGTEKNGNKNGPLQNGSGPLQNETMTESEKNGDTNGLLQNGGGPLQNEHITETEKTDNKKGPLQNGGGPLRNETITESEEIRVKNIIINEIKNNNKITRQEIATKAGVSLKRVYKLIKDIPEIKYVGVGRHGHWELNE